MAPPRPYWKGYLKLSLVSCPVALYTATSSGDRVAFRQINKKTGNRLRQQLVDEGTGDPIDLDHKGRGYEVDKGVYLRLGRFDDDVGRAGNEIVRFQKPINRGLRDKYSASSVKRTASSRGLSSG